MGHPVIASSMSIEPLSGAVGAIIHGVDISRELDDPVVERIRAALLAHLAVFFRDQDLSPEAEVRFARYFGELDRYPFVRGMDAYPDIVEVVKNAHETINFGGIWHSDTTYLECPPMGSILFAKVLPPTGGDTLFANMYLAYDHLSPGMKRLLERLVAVNSADKAEAAVTREDRIRDKPGDATGLVTIAEHPVVRTHPETGRKSLYVNPGHTIRFKGWTVEESAPILRYLYAHQTRPEWRTRFRWAPGSVAFWDNRAVQHYAVNDYHGYRRVMHRITLKGDRPR